MNANPSGLLDAIKAKLQLKTDAALACALETAPPLISKIRNHHLPIGDAMIVRILDADIMTLPEIRQFMPRVVA